MVDPYAAQIAAQLLAQNQANGPMKNFVNSIGLGAGKRALGIGELGLNGASAIAKALGMPTDKLQSMKNNIAMGQRYGDMEGQGTGAAGFVGEAMGDPTSYIPSPIKIAAEAPALAKIVGMGLHGGMNGLASGVTNGTQNPDSTLMDNTGNAVTGAAVGSALGGGIPLVAGATKVGANLAGGAGLRLASALGNNGASQSIAKSILAKQLLKDSITPQQVSQGIQNSSAMGLGGTLGESTQSPTVLQTEKQLVRGVGAPAKIMRDSLYNRNREQIPDAIQDQVDQLRQKGSAATGLYKDSADEAGNLYQNANAAVQGSNPNFPLQAAAPLNTAHSTLSDIQGAISNRLNQLGNVSNTESMALNKGNDIVKNAQTRIGNGENYFDTLLDAKKQLNNVYIDNATDAVQKQAQGHVAGYASAIDGTLKQLGPQNYNAAKSAAMANMSANDLSDALAESRTGSAAQLYSKLWRTPEMQQDFLNKQTLSDGTPDVATQQHFKNLFSELENVSRGHGGSDTAFNIPAATNLDNDVLGGNPDFLDVLHTAPDVARTVSKLYSPQVYKALAQQTLNPNEDSIVGAMNSRMTSPLNNSIVKGAAGVAGAIGGNQATQTSQDYNPYAALVPANNPYAALIPQGASQ